MNKNNVFYNQLVPYAKILKPYGLSGELKIQIFNSVSKLLKPDMKIWIESQKGKHLSYLIEDVSLGFSLNKIKLNGINSRLQANGFVSKKICLERNLLPKLCKGEYYFFDLLDSEVYDQNNKFIGLVIDLMHLPNNDLMVVRNDKDEILIPLNKNFLKLFDINKKIVRVDLIDGMI